MSLYAAMLRIDLKSARAKVTTTFHGEGSVRAETVMTRCKGVETTLELESDGEVQHLAKLARVAEAGCYVIQSLRHPTEVDYNVTVNGKPLDLGTS